MTLINTTNNNDTCLTFTELTEHKNDHGIWRWKSRIWLGTGIKCDRDSPVNGNYGISSLASWKLFTLLSKINSELDSKVHQTLEFVEVILLLFFCFGLSTRLSTLHVLGHIMTTNWQQLVQQPFYSKIGYFLGTMRHHQLWDLGKHQEQVVQKSNRRDSMDINTTLRHTLWQNGENNRCPLG